MHLSLPIPLRLRLALACALTCGLAWAPGQVLPTLAQSNLNKPIKVIVPFGPGGPSRLDTAHLRTERATQGNIPGLCGAP